MGRIKQLVFVLCLTAAVFVLFRNTTWILVRGYKKIWSSRNVNIDEIRQQIYGGESGLGLGYVATVLKGMPDPLLRPLIKTQNPQVLVTIFLDEPRSILDSNFVIAIQLNPKDMQPQKISDLKNSDFSFKSGQMCFKFQTISDYDRLDYISGHCTGQVFLYPSVHDLKLSFRLSPCAKGFCAKELPSPFSYHRGQTPFAVCCTEEQSALQEVWGTKFDTNQFVLLNEKQNNSFWVRKSAYLELIKQPKWSQYFQGIKQ